MEHRRKLRIPSARLLLCWPPLVLQAYAFPLVVFSLLPQKHRHNLPNFGSSTAWLPLAQLHGNLSYKKKKKIKAPQICMCTKGKILRVSIISDSSEHILTYQDIRIRSILVLLLACPVLFCWRKADKISYMVVGYLNPLIFGTHIGPVVLLP